MVFITNGMMKLIFFPLLLRGSGAKRWFLTGILLAFIGSVADPIWLKKMGAGKSLSMAIPLIYFILRRIGRLSLLKLIWSIFTIGLLEFILHTWVIDREHVKSPKQWETKCLPE